MHDSCVVAAFDSVEDARQAVHALEDSEFPAEQVSLVLGTLNQHPNVESDLEAGEDSVEDVMIGTGLGSLVGMVAGAAVLAVGGGMFLVIGALGGMITGAMVGTFLGAMSGWGVHGHRIEHYEDVVNSGHPLIIAHGDPVRLADAHETRQKLEPQELHRYAMSNDDVSPEAG